MTEAVAKTPEETLECYLPQITFKDVDLDPAFRLMPVRTQAMLIMKSMGFTNMEIGKMLGCTNEVVNTQMHTYDPGHKFRMTKEQIREVQKAYWLRVQNMAFATIRAEDMEHVSPEKKVRMASAAQKALDGLEQPKSVQVSAAALLKRLCESRAVTVEAQEIKDGKV